ncbi:hypothetical protein ACJX0J_032099, partial [Zea mays]
MLWLCELNVGDQHDDFLNMFYLSKLAHFVTLHTFHAIQKKRNDRNRYNKELSSKELYSKESVFAGSLLKNIMARLRVMHLGQEGPRITAVLWWEDGIFARVLSFVFAVTHFYRLFLTMHNNHALASRYSLADQHVTCILLSLILQSMLLEASLKPRFAEESAHVKQIITNINARFIDTLATAIADDIFHVNIFFLE